MTVVPRVAVAESAVCCVVLIRPLSLVCLGFFLKYLYFFFLSGEDIKINQLWGIHACHCYMDATLHALSALSEPMHTCGITLTLKRVKLPACSAGSV